MVMLLAFDLQADLTVYLQNDHYGVMRSQLFFAEFSIFAKLSLTA